MMAGPMRLWLRPPVRHDVGDRLEAGSWGVFFLWVAVTLIAHIPLSIGLLGVGVITLVAQGARKWFALDLQGFWVVVGLCFVLAGFWEEFLEGVPLGPILLLAFGAALLIGALAGSSKDADALTGDDGEG